MNHIHQSAGPTPVVIHVPHASAAVPSWVRDQIVIGDAELAEEQLKLVDHFTDELFTLPHDLATMVRFSVSRFVLDPERYAEDEREPMSARGMGVIYSKTTDGRALRRPLTPEERSALLEAYYQPHHRRLTEAVSAALSAHGRCLIIDGHSFASAPLPCDHDQLPSRPDICIGTDPYHTPQWLVDATVSACRDQRWSVEVGRPFDGTIVPLEYLNRNRCVWSVMIEVNKRLYLDEDTAGRSSDFQSCRSGLMNVLRALCAGMSTALARLERLTAVYPTTVFDARVDDLPISMRIGERSPQLDDALARLGSDVYAVITAWNPGSTPLSQSENDRRHQQLMKALEHGRTDRPLVFPAWGKLNTGDWAPEQSLLIVGLSSAAAVEIGRRFGQNAVVVGRKGEPPQLAWCL
jgi:N-formylglutamate amidohydrolase